MVSPSFLIVVLMMLKAEALLNETPSASTSMDMAVPFLSKTFRGTLPEAVKL